MVASYGEIEHAWACTGRLRANGFAPILITPEDVESDASRFLVRTFALGPRSLSVTSRRGDSAEIPFGDIDLFLRATRLEEHTETKTTESRKFDAGRAILSGGLLLTKKTKTVRQVTTEERDEFLQLYSAGRKPVIFHATGLNYQPLGADLQPSTVANFARLIEKLRRRPPTPVTTSGSPTAPAGRAFWAPSRSGTWTSAVSLLARVLRTQGSSR